MKREKFSSRLGFLLISAGCAIGIGNVWRFPWVAGKYGGALFVIIYLFFLVVIGLPIMTMEFAVGRASQKSAAASFRVLEPKGTKWHIASYMDIAGNYILMMFYTTVGGWMLNYFFKTLRGEFTGLKPDQVASKFSLMLESPFQMVFWMIIITCIGFAVCSLGLQNGVEKVTKYMMSALFIVMIILVVKSVTLPGAEKGIAFYLIPDLERVKSIGLSNIIVAAMGQSFFTLSIGIGSMAIFGSYMSKNRSLFGESLNIGILDTSVALLSGLIIFPACYSFGVNVESGPPLVFVTLPNIFNAMAGGQFWGSLFFIFMTFASLTTIIAVFENIISFGMDLFNWTRKKAVAINVLLIPILSLPCALGFNVLKHITPFGLGSNIQDLEDFLVSNIFLPFGSLIFLVFCVSRYGWGFKNFLDEANTGQGVKFPKWARVYVTYILPLLILFLFVQGIYTKFHS